jgi:hypothetical protein
MRLAAAAALSCVLATAGHAQVRPSQRQEILQRVGDTEIRVRYIRPVARGRELFGRLVPYGREWTPSADSAFRISFSKDVKIQGETLAAGTYSVWLTPDSSEWKFTFNKTPDTHHLRHSASDDVLHVTAKVETLPHVETLETTFPTVDGLKATMRIHWGTKAAALEIEASQ